MNRGLRGSVVKNFVCHKNVEIQRSVNFAPTSGAPSIGESCFKFNMLQGCTLYHYTGVRHTVWQFFLVHEYAYCKGGQSQRVDCLCTMHTLGISKGDRMFLHALCDVVDHRYTNHVAVCQRVLTSVYDRISNAVVFKACQVLV